MRGWLTAAAAAVIVTTVSAQETRTSGSLERPLSANDRVTMDLVAGDYRITGSPANRVRIDWTVRDAESLPKFRVFTEERQKELTIVTRGPSNSHGRFTIQLPNQSDLYVRLTAGNIYIEDIRGNKDVRLRAGDMRVDVGRAEDYGIVDASLWAGDINALAFQTVKGGLFRSFEWSGTGRYRLRARLMAGNIYLYSKAAEAR
jgi:hypothetical protein